MSIDFTLLYSIRTTPPTPNSLRIDNFKLAPKCGLQTFNVSPFWVMYDFKWQNARKVMVQLLIGVHISLQHITFRITAKLVDRNFVQGCLEIFTKPYYFHGKFE